MCPEPLTPVASAAAAGDDQDVEQARVRAKVRQSLFGGPAAPVRVEHFELLGRLGAGAMGVVYEARDTELDRVVALKLLHPTLLARPGSEGTGLLLAEARAMARVRHPNVLTVHQVGTHANQVYLAMERANGSLRDWLARERPTSERILEVLIATGKGLAAVHRQGLVHRDFKPDNVLMDDAGQPRVSDFGLAMRADTLGASPASGTPAYMAPEQLRGAEVDARGDQWAFAVTAIEALTCRRPFQAQTRAELLEKTLQRLGPAQLGRGLAPGVAEILLRALEPEPSARFASMDALLERLELIRSGQASKSSARWPLFAGLGVLGTAAIVAAAVLALASRREQRASAPESARSSAPVESTAPLPIRDVTRLCVTAHRASSEQSEHPASHAFDGIPSTAWSESVPGDGEGEWLEVELRPDTWISALELSGGWSMTTSSGVDLWEHNATLRKARVIWDGGEAEVGFDRKADRAQRKRVVVEAKTRRLRIQAVDVDRGRFRDLCLDEVAIFGRCPAP